MAVEGNADDGSGQLMFGRDGREVSDMVLNSQHRKSHRLGE